MVLSLAMVRLSVTCLTLAWWLGSVKSIYPPSSCNWTLILYIGNLGFSQFLFFPLLLLLNPSHWLTFLLLLSFYLVVMKLTVKTLKGSHFQIEVQPTDTVSFSFSSGHLISRSMFGWTANGNLWVSDKQYWISVSVYMGVWWIM